MPATWAVQLLSTGVGDEGTAGATFTGQLELAAGQLADNGALIVTAADQATAFQAALTGSIMASYQGETASYAFSATTSDVSTSSHRAYFLESQPTDGRWRVGLEDLSAANMQPLGVDWDYDDRNWMVDVREYQAPTIGQGDGLLARYYNAQDFTSLGLIRVDAVVNNQWGNGSPDPLIQSDHFSAQWSGQVMAKYTDMYTFKTYSDDGIRVWVNGQMVVDNMTDHGPMWDGNTQIALTAGQLYTIQVAYYENGGGATAQLLWEGQDHQPLEVIPQSQLYSEPVPSPVIGKGIGLNVSYYNNQNLADDAAHTDLDATVDHNWGSGSPAPQVNADHFSARWEGEVQASYSGEFTFYTQSDDGVRLWVNGELVIDNWTDHGPTEDRSAPILLSAGEFYDIKMEYFENSGGAVARLLWSSDNQVKGIIPQSQLYGAPPQGSTVEAVDDTADLAGASQVTISVLDNDTAGTKIIEVTDPEFGTADISGNSIGYTLGAGFGGTDEFMYRIEDRYGRQASATVRIADVNTVWVSTESVDPTAEVPDSDGDPVSDFGIVRFSRTGPTVDPLTVYYSTSGDAVADLNYQSLSGFVVIPAGASSVDVQIVPLAGDLGENQERTLLVAVATPPDPNSLPFPYKARTGVGALAGGAGILLFRQIQNGRTAASVVNVVFLPPEQSVTRKMLAVYSDPVGTRDINTGAVTVTEPSRPLAQNNRAPAVYTVGDKAQVHVTFKADILSKFPQGNVWVRGRLASVDGEPLLREDFFAPSKIKVTAGAEVSFSADLVAKEAFASVIGHKSVTFSWEFGFGANPANITDWTPAYEPPSRPVSQSPSVRGLYVTLAKPLQPQDPIHLSSLWQGCFFGHGATNSTELIDRIWRGADANSPGTGTFASRAVQTHAGGTMSYYGSWFSNRLTASELLATGSSQCVGWAEYLMDVLRIHGIPSSMQKITVDPQSELADPLKTNLAVGNWTADSTRSRHYNLFAAPPQGKLSRTFASVPVWRETTAGNPQTWHYSFNANRSQAIYSGSDSQSNPMPNATFANHEVVRVGNDLYDPSYGQVFKAAPDAKAGEEFQSALLKFQVASVFGFYKVTTAGKRIADPNNPGATLVAANEVYMEIDRVSATKLQLRTQTVTEVK